MSIKPPKLQPGARIGVCAPSSRLSQPNFDLGVAVLKDAGFHVVVHPQSFLEHGQIAGSAEARATAFQELLLDSSVDAVFFAGGGHRAAEIIPLLDWNALQKFSPKIVMGYSDNTVLLHALRARLDWVTFYGPTVQSLGRKKGTHPETWAQTLSLLQGKPPVHKTRYTGPAVEGTLVAATLAMLPLLLDTQDVPDLNGTILCIEDLHEELTTIDRQLLLLRRKGVFDKITALLCGEFLHLTDSGRPFGFTLEEIVRHQAGDIPVAFDAPFGHGDMLYPLPIGVKARLDNNTLILLEPAVI